MTALCHVHQSSEQLSDQSSDQSPPKSHCLVFADFDVAQPHWQHLLSQFHSHSVLPGVYGKKKGLLRQASIVKNARSLLSQATTFGHRYPQLQQLFVFNDYRPETQAIIHLTRQQTSASILALEDGLNPYINELAPRHSPFASKILSKILGFRWHPLVRIGLHPQVQALGVFNPEMVQEELTNRTFKLSVDSLVSDQMRSLASDVLKHFHLSPTDFSTQDEFLFLPHSEKIPNFTEQVIQLLSDHQQSDHRCWVKFHPREFPQQISEIKPHIHGQSILPAQLPTELLLFSIPQPKRILTSLSTSGLSARRIFANLEIKKLPLSSFEHSTKNGQVETYIFNRP